MSSQAPACSAGRHLIRSRLRSTAILLVLDDVEAGHVEALLDVSALAPGSLIIVTPSA